MYKRSSLAAARIGRRACRRAPFAVAAVVALTLGGGGIAAASGGPAIGSRPGHAAASAASAAHPASWRIVKTVRGTAFPHFTAVTATSGHGGWAFEATASATAVLRPAAWRLRGSRWSRARFPGRPGEQVISASSTSPGDVWALLTGADRSRVLRWNGRGWTVTGRFGQAHDDLVAVGPADAWMFGTGAWHFTGHRWAHPRSGRGLLGGSPLGHDSVWAFGQTVVAHWNGHAWARTPVTALLPRKGPLNHPRLTGIYARSATSVWAVGTTGRESEGGPVVLLHFNGHRWHRQLLADAGAGFPGQVIPDGSGGLWIPFGFVFRSFTMLHYAGGKLRQVALPAPAGTVLQVAAVTAVPGTSQAFAAAGAWPAGGPIGGYTRALILAHR